MLSMRTLLLPALSLALLAGTVTAETPGVRRLVIFCGHPGDAEYRGLLAGQVDQLVTGLTSHWGFAPDQARVLFGTPAMLSDGGPRPEHATGPCTRAAMEQTLSEVQAALQPDDALWVIVLGHAHFDGRLAWFNIPGDDPDQEQLAALFTPLACRESVYWFTTAVSGYFLRPLTGEGRILISATEADSEVNATIFPGILAEIVSSPPPDEELDVDGDGVISVLDLYLLTARRVAQQYVDEDLIRTEHAQLEDNGDGRISEVQRGFLSEALGGRRKAGTPAPVLEKGRDGYLARQILLPLTRPQSETP